MRDYETLSQAMNALREEGYTDEFNLAPDCIECKSGNYHIVADDIHVDHYYRFEGMTDPGDASILYAISDKKHGLKGLLVNGYGIYTEGTTDAIMARLTID